MIPISLNWDTRKRCLLLKWNGFISSGWRYGKMSMRILGLPIPLLLKKKRIRSPVKLPVQWIYLKGIFTFLTSWRLKKVEGTLSFPMHGQRGTLRVDECIPDTESGRKDPLDCQFLRRELVQRSSHPFSQSIVPSYQKLDLSLNP